MARLYSRRTFLRQTPKAMLKDYFTKKGLLAEFDFGSLKKTAIEPLSDAIGALPEEDLAKVEADFEKINEMAYPKGTQAILEEASFRGHDWAEQFTKMANHYERAFWCFLNDWGTFDVAGHFEDMDRYGFGERRTIFKDLEPKVERANLDALANAITAVYRKQTGSRYCAVDNYLRRDPERHCYFVYPEDHPTTELAFGDDKQLRPVARRPVFEIIFVYRPETGLFEIRAQGNREHKEELMRIFCQTILGLEDLPEENAQPDFDLSGFKDRGMAFPTDKADGVDAVEVKMVRFGVPGGNGRRITWEATPSQRSPQALYDLIDDALNKGNVPLSAVHVDRARLRMTFAPRNNDRAKKLTFEVAHPNRCNLTDDKFDQIAKKCLLQWGIARG